MADLRSLGRVDKEVGLATSAGLGLAVAMGVGRFFYTPILPLMVDALSWSKSVSSVIAAVNYLGYLIGSIALARGWMSHSRRNYRVNLVFTTILLFLMAATDDSLVQGVIRLLAGVSSAIVFVCITQAAAINVKNAKYVGFLYGGVGLGITLSGLLVWRFSAYLTWAQLWCCAGVVSLVFSAVAWNWPVKGTREELSQAKNETTIEQRPSSKIIAFYILDTGYFLQGLGYIIIGTYLVVLAEPIFGKSAAAMVWAIAGVAAFVSPIGWSVVSSRIGRRRALLLCYTLQVCGALAAVFGDSRVMLIAAAILFGGTFMGITMLTIATGVDNAIPGGAARLTTWYSIGQVVGPALIAVISAAPFVAAFVVAGLAIGVGMICTFISRL